MKDGFRGKCATGIRFQIDGRERRLRRENNAGDGVSRRKFRNGVCAWSISMTWK